MTGVLLVVVATMGPASEPAWGETPTADRESGSGLGWHQLADGVYAAVQPHATRFDDANSMIVIGRTGVLVVDAQANRETVEGVITKVAKLTDLPIRWVVNTHWHGDHVQGNAVYRAQVGAGVLLVAHDTLAEDIPARAEPGVAERIAQLEEIIPIAEAQLAKGLSRGGDPLDAEGQIAQRESIDRAKEWLATNRDVVFLTPDLTYSDRLTLSLGGRSEATSEAGEASGSGGRRVELIHLTGHTRGDTVVYLPDDGILASGDLVDAAPYGGHGYPSRWIAALDRLLALDWTTVVPGHGPVMQGKDHLRAVRAYFAELVRQVRAIVETDSETESALTAEAIAERLDLSEVEEGLARGDEGVTAFLRGSLVETVGQVLAELSDSGA